MSFLSRFFGGKNKSVSVLGLDIGSSSLKVVQLRRDQGVVILETYGELALGPYAGGEVGQATNMAAEKIAETLRDLMREANITTNDAGVSIPFSRSLLKLLTLPYRENPEEQKTVIELEARKYIPVPVTEVQLDWFIVPPVEVTTEAPGSIEVLLVAVHNDELALLNGVVTGANIAASFYEIEIFSTIRAVVDEPVKPVLVLDIGASATKVYVVEHGVVAFSHNIPEGGQDVTRTIAAAQSITISKAEILKKEHGFGAQDDSSYEKSTIELVFSRIFEEAHRAILQYETAKNKKISGLVLTGGGGGTKELAAYAKTFFSVDVKIADPFSKTEAPAFMRPVLEAIGPEFAVAVGLALRKLEEGE